MASRSSRSSPSISTASSSSSLASTYSKNHRPRNLPRRGQIKAGIFASIVKSIARFLGVQRQAESADGANSSNGTGSSRHLSDVRLDVIDGLSSDKGGRFGLSARSSPLSTSSTPRSFASKRLSSASVSPSPCSPFKQLSRPCSFHAGMIGKS